MRNLPCFSLLHDYKGSFKKYVTEKIAIWPPHPPM